MLCQVGHFVYIHIHTEFLTDLNSVLLNMNQNALTLKDNCHKPMHVDVWVVSPFVQLKMT